MESKCFKNSYKYTQIFYKCSRDPPFIPVVRPPDPPRFQPKCDIPPLQNSVPTRLTSMAVHYLFLVVARVVTEECCNRRTRTNPRPPAQGRSLVQGRVGQQRRLGGGAAMTMKTILSMPSVGRSGG